MATWSEVALLVSGKATKSQPPVQWVYMVVLLVVAGIAGWMITREMDRVSLEKAELEIARKRLEEFKTQAQIADKIAEATKFRLLAKEMDKTVDQLETEVSQLERNLKDQVAALEQARHWREIADA